VVRTSCALAAFADRVYLLVGKTDPDEGRLLRYYGVSAKSNFIMVQLPILRRRRKAGFSWSGVYNLFALWWLWRMRKRIDFISLRSDELANFLLKFRWVLEIPIIYEIHQLPRLYGPEGKSFPGRPGREASEIVPQKQAPADN